MEILYKTDPEIYYGFLSTGNSIASYTQNTFSSMAINKRHEQLHKNIKGKERIVGITEDEDKFHRWLLCTPEVPGVIAEFEAQNFLKNNKHHQDFHHREDSKTFPSRFQGHVDVLSKRVRTTGKLLFCS